MNRILVVDDEPQISSLVSRGLTSAGFSAVTVDNGQDALSTLEEDKMDLVILDVGMPMMDGFEVLRILRARGSRIPVIMLTARGNTRDTVEGLDAGASDYVTKPFVIAELVARVRSRLRESAVPAATTLVRADVSLDVLRRTASLAGKPVDLSAREFALAEEFLRGAGQVLTREYLLSRVWGLHFDPGSNVVDVYVSYLRAKFGSDRIVTVRGEGYRWE